MKKTRFAKTPRVLAGLYFVWSSFVYFGSLMSSGDAHAWWPMFLYPLIWPWGWFYERVLGPVIRDSIISNPKLADESMWMMNDYAAGAYYIVVGTLWFYFIGVIISRIANRFFTREEAPNQPPEPTPTRRGGSS